MAKNNSAAGQKVRKEFMKKLSAGKVLCSEINKATNNTKFLYMRRHDAFVNQLESARQSMLTENGRAQKDVLRRLDRYKHRKRSIFREKLLSQREDSQLEELEDEESSVSQSAGTHHSCSHPSATSQSSRARSMRRKSSSYSVSLHPPSGSSTGSSVFPAILKVPMAEEDQEHINTAIQRELHQYMRKQEGLQAHILRSRVHEFCRELDSAWGCSSSRRRRHCVSQGSAHSAAATVRRKVFSEGEATSAIPLSAKSRRVVTSSKGNLKNQQMSLPSLT